MRDLAQSRQSGAGAVWFEKSDAEVLAAAGRIAEYTEEGEKLIRAELNRRGLPGLPTPVGSCRRCGRSIAASYPRDNCQQCGEHLEAAIIAQLDDSAYKRRLSPRAVVILSGLVAWPLWIGILVATGLFVEEVLGWKESYAGAEWFVELVAFSIIGIGFLWWRVVGALVAHRWGEPGSLPNKPLQPTSGGQSGVE
jgi:hypothetical protein